MDYSEIAKKGYMSAQIIAYTARIDFKTLLDIECKGLTGFAPVVKDTLDEFQSLITILSDIDVLIIDEPAESKNYHFLLELVAEKKDIKNIILLGNEGPIMPAMNFKIFSHAQVPSLIDYLKTILLPESKQTSEFISVPADSLIHFKMLPFDLFIKISNEKFVKRIPANEDIDDSTVEGFQSKGITELYFEKKYNRDFSMMLLNNMINKVEKNYISVDEKLKASNEVFATAKEIVQSVGLPPRVLQVCESVMESITVDVMKSKDRFSSYLSQRKAQKELKFQFRFLELTSFIATQIIDGLELNDKDIQLKTILFAAFFCDITLTNASHLEYRSEESIKDLWHEDEKTISHHAQKASLLIEKYKNAPKDADRVVREHHGSPTGVGFPKISDTLLPLSLALIASQELALAILKNPERQTEAVIKEIIGRFKETPLSSYLLLFESSLKSEA